MRTIMRLMGHLRPYKRQAILSYGMLILGIGMQIAVPLLIQYTINKGINSGNETVLAIACISIVVIVLLQATFGYTRSYWLQYLAERVAYDVRNEMYQHLQRLSFSYYDRAQTGQLISRATEDVNNMRRFFLFGLRLLVQSSLMLIGITIVMLNLNWRLALLSLSTMPILIVVTVWFGVKIRPLFLSVQTQFGNAMTVLQENLAGVRVVRAFAREPYEIRKFAGEADAVYNKQMDAARSWTLVFPLMSLIAGLGTAIVIAYGGSGVIRGDLQLGTLLAFNLYLTMLAEPVRNIGWVVNNVARAQASAERVYEILDKTPEIVTPPDAFKPTVMEGHVRLENAEFAYPDGGRPVLRGVSIDARPGGVVGLIGSTGSGKSSLIQLLPRFYDVTGGGITVDGVDVRQWDLPTLRKNVGLVLQETFLFSVSVRENIAYGRPDATDAEVEAAARAAQAHEFILNLPQGYATELGERGVNISGGQKQRIAIARALLLDPRILVLDDATSAVDMETEYEIQQALDILMQGRTTFIIAQRLSSVRHAEQICVLDEGKIVERGTHDELLAQNGAYRRLFDMQVRAQDAAFFVDEITADGD